MYARDRRRFDRGLRRLRRRAERQRPCELEGVRPWFPQGRFGGLRRRRRCREHDVHVEPNRPEGRSAIRVRRPGFPLFSVLARKEWRHNSFFQNGVYEPRAPNDNPYTGVSSFYVSPACELAYSIPLPFTGLPRSAGGFVSVILPKGPLAGGSVAAPNKSRTEVFAQPRLTLDVGKDLLARANTLDMFVGYRSWLNKSGNNEKDTTVNDLPCSHESQARAGVNVRFRSRRPPRHTKRGHRAPLFLPGRVAPAGRTGRDRNSGSVADKASGVSDRQGITGRPGPRLVLNRPAVSSFPRGITQSRRRIGPVPSRLGTRRHRRSRHGDRCDGRPGRRPDNAGRP